MLIVGQDKCYYWSWPKLNKCKHDWRDTHPVFVHLSSQQEHLQNHHLKRLYWSVIVLLKQQVLGQVTPKPTEVIRASALRFPDLNRTMDFLPCEKFTQTELPNTPTILLWWVVWPFSPCKQPIDCLSLLPILQWAIIGRYCTGTEATAYLHAAVQIKGWNWFIGC